MVDYATARLNMVEGQLRSNRVTDPALLEAFQTVPRERFVPEPLRGIAYVDEDLEIGQGRYLMEPRVLGRLLQAARPGRGDIALDIGCATGYASAILARLSATVVALECDPKLSETASRTLSELGIDNAVVVHGPLADGCPGQAPYNVIVIDGAVHEVPEALGRQLADGGRLVTVVKDSVGMGRAMLYQRTGEVVAGRVLFDAAVPVLPGFQGAPGFVF